MRALILAFLGVFFLFTSAFAQDDPVRKIEQVRGDLYMFSEGDTNGVFLVTDEGIILADPISHDNAVWLKAELDERFGKQVKIVIYSHHHAEHISGGEVFADTATFVAHENAKAKIEEGGYTTPPGTVFETGIRLELGGKRVEVYHFSQLHTDNLGLIFFPGQKAVFLVDAVVVESFAYPDMLGAEFGTVQGNLLTIENFFEFKHLVTGHGKAGKKKDLSEYIKFLFALQDGVLSAIGKGATKAEMATTVDLERFNNYAHYADWRVANIDAAYKKLTEGELVPVKKVNPLFPRRAVEKGVCGTVTVIYDVKDDGTTENVRILDAEPRGYFERETIAAAEQYVYAPGKATKDVTTTINFEIAGICRAPDPSAGEAIE